MATLVGARAWFNVGPADKLGDALSSIEGFPPGVVNEADDLHVTLISRRRDKIRPFESSKSQARAKKISDNWQKLLEGYTGEKIVPDLSTLRLLGGAACVFLDKDSKTLLTEVRQRLAEIAKHEIHNSSVDPGFEPHISLARVGNYWYHEHHGQKVIGGVDLSGFPKQVEITGATVSGLLIAAPACEA